MDTRASPLVCPWCPIPSVIGLVVLFLAPETGSWVRDPIVFFDAVCINQVNERIKMEGVYSLGGFIRNSEEMVVLWSPSYFRRCWCVYEVAAFVRTHGPNRMRFSPVFLHCWEVSGYLSLTVCFLIESVLVCAGASRMVRLTVGIGSSFVPIFFVLRTGRTYMHDKHNLEQQMDTFAIEQAECREEADRDLILECVKMWFGDPESFDDFVRGDLKKSILSGLQNFRLSFRSSLMMTSPCLSYAVQWSIACARSEQSLEGIVSWAAPIVSLSLFGAPPLFKLVMAVCERFRQPLQSGSANQLLNIFLSCLIYVVIISFSFLILTLADRLRLGGVVVAVFFLAVNIYLFRSQWRRQLRQLCRTSATDNSSQLEASGPSIDQLTIGLPSSAESQRNEVPCGPFENWEEEV